MSISFITGIPGSGKTYYAVNEIYENFIKEKAKENNYLYCYTNINELDFSRSDKLLPYKHSEFYEKLQSLYTLYLEHKSDEELLKLADELKISHSLIIIDECHNFFDKEDEILIWFFTYHRHLFLDVLMITQDMALVFNKYKSIAEFFFLALPNSKKINLSKFKYRQFLSHKMYQKDKIGDFSLSKKSEIFSLYKSGAIVKSKSVVRKFLFLFLILAVVTFVVFKLFLANLKSKGVSEVEPGETQQKQIMSISNQNNKNDFVIKAAQEKMTKDNQQLFFVYDVICIDEKKCFVNNEFQIDFKAFKYITSNSDYLHYEKEEHKNYLHLILVYDFEIFKNFSKFREKDEKNNFMSNVL